MANIGIDYGLGTSNVDRNTGIRYGVISVHSLADWVAGEAEPIYPDSVEIECPECGHSFDTDNLCPDDYQTCPECEHQWREHGLDYLDPIGWNYAAGDSQYTTESSESLNAVFVTKSPYYTYGRFCSPCAPGAIDLDNTVEPHDGPKAYCFGHEYFDGDKAPYRVFRVADDTEVLPA